MSARQGLEIRAVLATDAPYLADLLASGGHEILAAELSRRLEAVRAGAGATLVASDWGPPVGLIALQWQPSILSAKPVAWVTLLLVGPESRRRGIGRALLKAGAQAARSAGCGDLRLLAPDDRKDMLAFAESTGFAAAGAALVRPLRKGREARGP